MFLENQFDIHCENKRVGYLHTKFWKLDLWQLREEDFIKQQSQVEVRVQPAMTYFIS